MAVGNITPLGLRARRPAVGRFPPTGSEGGPPPPGRAGRVRRGALQPRVPPLHQDRLPPATAQPRPSDP